MDNDPLGVETGKFQQGNNSRQGFGGLSQSIDAAPQNEPIVYMFDSGRGWKKTTGYTCLTLKWHQQADTGAANTAIELTRVLDGLPTLSLREEEG